MLKEYISESSWIMLFSHLTPVGFRYSLLKTPTEKT